VIGRPRDICSTVGACITRSSTSATTPSTRPRSIWSRAPTVERLTDGGKICRRSQQIGLPEQSGLTVNASRHIEPGRLGPTVEYDLHKVLNKLGMTTREHSDRAVPRG
jgi:hypothetical protein